jgi:hypothetical protein
MCYISAVLILYFYISGLWHCYSCNWCHYSEFLLQLHGFHSWQILRGSSFANCCGSYRLCGCIFWLLWCCQRKPLHDNDSKFCVAYIIFLFKSVVIEVILK